MRQRLFFKHPHLHAETDILPHNETHEDLTLMLPLPVKNSVENLQWEHTLFISQFYNKRTLDGAIQAKYNMSNIWFYYILKKHNLNYTFLLHFSLEK